MPSGSSVVLSWRRGSAIGATYRHAGFAAPRSMTSTVAVGISDGGLAALRGFPPAMSTLPGSYMTEEPYSR